MAFLTLGGTTVEVQTAGASEPEQVYLGEAARAFSGGYRSGVRGGKRSWAFQIIPLVQADLAALRTLVGPVDTPIAANGDFNGGTSVSVVVRIAAVGFISDGATGFLRTASLTLLEV
jgi:hypothetical protein